VGWPVEAGEETRGLHQQGREELSQAEVVYLQPEDTSATIRGRVEAAEDSRVLLVVPKGCPGLDSVVDLKVLLREVVALNKEVALVTRDRKLRELAHSLGFRTFTSAARGQRAKWSGPSGRGSVPAQGRLTRESLGESIPVPPRTETVGVGGKLILGVAFVGMLAFLGLMLAIFVPTATVTLHPVVYPVSTELSVEGSPGLESIDFINLRVPARVVEMEVVGDDQLATTALRDEPDALAVGEVVFTNKRSEATTVVSDTIVTTSGGTTIRFRTTDEVTLPPQVGGRGRAPIEAVEPGPSGNVTAYSINRVEGPMNLQVNVINVAPTEGGGMSQATYVTNADKEQLREESLRRLKEEGYDSLMVELTGEEMLPYESLLAIVLSETYDHFPGEVADSLRLHLRALIRGTVIDRGDVDLLGLRMLQLEVREGFQLLSEETQISIDEISDVQYDGTLMAEISARGQSWVEIDAGEIRQSIRGLEVAEVQESLARHFSLESEPSIEVSPEWWGRLPWLPFRIAVHVESENALAE
jgi:hypothetical protein